MKWLEMDGKDEAASMPQAVALRRAVSAMYVGSGSTPNAAYQPLVVHRKALNGALSQKSALKAT